MMKIAVCLMAAVLSAAGAAQEVPRCTLERDFPDVIDTNEELLPLVRVDAALLGAGKNLLLEVWPTACSGCRSKQEVPELKGIRRVQTSYDQLAPEFQDLVSRFRVREQSDPEKPISLLFKADGTLKYRIHGYLPWERCGFSQQLETLF